MEPSAIIQVWHIVFLSAFSSPSHLGRTETFHNSHLPSYCSGIHGTCCCWHQHPPLLTGYACLHHWEPLLDCQCSCASRHTLDSNLWLKAWWKQLPTTSKQDLAPDFSIVMWVSMLCNTWICQLPPLTSIQLLVLCIVTPHCNIIHIVAPQVVLHFIQGLDLNRWPHAVWACWQSPSFR